MADPMAEFNKKVIDEFRSNGGNLSGQFAAQWGKSCWPERR